MPNIICQSCQFENDPSRVFCQNCGIRLERPAGMAFQGPSKRAPSPGAAAPQTRPAPAKPAPVSSHRAAQNPSAANKRASPIAALFVLVFALVRWAAYGAVVAAVVLMLMKPENVHEPIPVGQTQAPASSDASAPTADDPDESRLSVGLQPSPQQTQPPGSIADIAWAKVQTAAEEPYPRQASLSERQVNAVLAENLILEPSSTAQKIGWDYLGASFTPEKDSFTLSLVQSILGRPIYFNGQFEPFSAANRMNVRLVGGSIGRLELPGFISPLLARVFQPATVSMKSKLDLLEKANKVEISSEGVLLNFPGAQR